MSNAEECCQRSGVQMPNPPPSGYNAWDTLPSPRTPRTTRSSITSPDQISLMPADDESSLVRKINCFSISLFDVPIHLIQAYMSTCQLVYLVHSLTSEYSDKTVIKQPHSLSMSLSNRVVLRCTLTKKKWTDNIAGLIPHTFTQLQKN